MAAPKGNRFWEARSKHGRDKIFSDKDVLWKASLEYFEWVEDNPLREDKPFNYQGLVVPNTVNKMRAMTLDGLWLFLDIGHTTWYRYKDDNDFEETITKIENVIKSQKFAGAAADLLNANIIARDLGLADKKELQGKDGQPLIPTAIKIIHE
ncbi:Phage terminase, small subunit [hydrothermal vent metagenome]|uniref:Phage terminase, small subunit n=1 Tax=hydrothermal vent metagenome TaxID=652676 RepID=A0A3B0VE84_9ZZZZ